MPAAPRTIITHARQRKNVLGTKLDLVRVNTAESFARERCGPRFFMILAKREDMKYTYGIRRSRPYRTQGLSIEKFIVPPAREHSG